MSVTDTKNNSYLANHWFWGGVLACKKIYGQVAAASVFINLFALASSLYIMTVYDRVIPNRALESLWALTMIMLVVLVFDFLMKMTRASFVDYAGALIDRRISDMLFRRVLNNDDFMKNNATGALASIVREFDFLRDLIGSATFTVLVDLP
ncbi:MAG: type I secretion system permease/ATPase, partial [Alphaproteobacteria bacterium]|nr:type I secretion system permease/ATPase [Alphaproteobacteria bacterium]